MRDKELKKLGVAVRDGKKETPLPGRLLSCEFFFLLAGSLSAVLGLTVLIGWHTQIARIVAPLPGLVSMKYNTALCFLLVGIGLLAHSLRWRRWGQFFGVLPVVVCVLVLAQYGFGFDLGLDQLFIEDHTTAQTSHPGRMAPNTAVCFVLAGGGLVLLGRRLKGRDPSLPVALLGSVLLVLALISLIGYGLGMPSLYGWPQFTRMAVHTAAGMLVLGLGLCGALWAESLRRSGNLSYALPFVVGLAVATSAVVYWQALIGLEYENIARRTAVEAESLKGFASRRIAERTAALFRMAKRQGLGGYSSEEAWQSDAELYLEDFTSLEVLAWVDRDMRARWTVQRTKTSAPLAGDSAWESQLVPTMERAQSRREIQLSPMLNLGTDGSFAMVVPVYADNGFDGFIVGLFNSQQILDAITEEAARNGFVVAALENEREIYRHAAEGRPSHTYWTVERETELPGVSWRWQVWPSRSLADRWLSPLPHIILGVGLLLAIVLAGIVRLAQATSHQARELARTNRALQEEALQRERAQEALAEHTQELARSNAELEQFAYVASHDLQEPLRMVSSYVQLLAQRYREKLDPDADDFIAFAVDGASRMQQLINDLLAYSRVGRKGRPFAPLNAETVLNRTLHNLELTLEESGGVVTHDPMPEVFGDETQFGQLLQNLIANAIKFRGPEDPHIHVSAKRNGQEWIFSVRDNGLGIDPQYSKRIFLIFQRLHGREEYPGTGIGLAVCNKIVERHGGRIWVESESGKGATFYFTIPVPSAAATQMRVEERGPACYTGRT